MISLIVQGRLGNQMFQYSFLRGLQEKGFDREINMDFSSVYKTNKPNEGWENSLKYFNVKTFKETTNYGLSFSQKVSNKIITSNSGNNTEINLLNWDKYCYNYNLLLLLLVSHQY